MRSKALLDRSFLNLAESRRESNYSGTFETCELERERRYGQTVSHNPSYSYEKPSSVHYTPILGLRSAQQESRKKNLAHGPTVCEISRAPDKMKHVRALRQLNLNGDCENQMKPIYSTSQSRMMLSAMEDRRNNILEVDYIWTLRRMETNRSKWTRIHTDKAREVGKSSISLIKYHVELFQSSARKFIFHIYRVFVIFCAVKS